MELHTFLLGSFSSLTSVQEFLICFLKQLAVVVVKVVIIGFVVVMILVLVVVVMVIEAVIVMVAPKPMASIKALVRLAVI